MITGPKEYDGYLGEITAKDWDVPVCEGFSRGRPFSPTKDEGNYPGNSHSPDISPYFCDPANLWYHVTFLAEDTGKLVEPRCGAWLNIWEIMPVEDMHSDRRGEVLEGRSRVGQAIKIRDDADLSNAYLIAPDGTKDGESQKIRKYEWNLVQGLVGTIQHATQNEGGHWTYTVLVRPKRADPRSAHYHYKWTQKGVNEFLRDFEFEAGLCLPENHKLKEGEIVSKECAEAAVEGVTEKTKEARKFALPFGIDSLVAVVGGKEGVYDWMKKYEVKYTWQAKAKQFYAENFPEKEQQLVQEAEEARKPHAHAVDMEVTDEDIKELLEKFNLKDLNELNDHYKLDFKADDGTQVDPDTQNEMIGGLSSTDLQPEMLNSMRHKLERMREHAEAIKNEVNERAREKVHNENTGSVLSAADLKKYEQIIWDHRADTWPKQDDVNTAVREIEENPDGGMASSGKRLDQMRRMYSALIPDVAKARILSGADSQANGIKHNIKELGHHGLTFLGSAIGSKKLGDHIIKFLRSAHKATRTNGKNYGGPDDDLYASQQMSNYADELRTEGEDNWGDFGEFVPKDGLPTVFSESWPHRLSKKREKTQAEQNALKHKRNLTIAKYNSMSLKRTD
jgi:hypothetical protein